VTENRQRQSADSYIPEYTERTRLPERHSHAPERPRYRGGFNQRSSQRQRGSQRGSQRQRGIKRDRQSQYTRQQQADETAPSRENERSGARG